MSKLLKTIAYAFMLSAVILLFLMFSKPTFNGVNIVKIVCLAIMGVIVIIFLILYLFCKNDNQRIDKMLDNNDYDNLLTYASKMKSKKMLFLGERKNYYEYLQILCYFCLDDKDNMKVVYDFDYKDVFPMTYFWMACLEFSNNNIENINKYYERYIHNGDVSRRTNQLYNYINTFYSLDLYARNEIKKAQDNLNSKVDVSKLSMKVTLDSIEIIKNAVIDKQEDKVLENK